MRPGSGRLCSTPSAPDSECGMRIFHSVHHPGDEPAARVYGRALVKPIAATVLPLMIAVTASALQLGVVWPYVMWGLPTSLAVASVWTRFRLGNQPAEVRLQPGQAAVRSVHDVLTGTPPDFQPIHDVRVTSDTLSVMVGYTTLAIEAPDWPAYNQMKEAFRSARHGRESASEATASSTSFSPYCRG